MCWDVLGPVEHRTMSRGRSAPSSFASNSFRGSFGVATKELLCRALRACKAQVALGLAVATCQPRFERQMWERRLTRPVPSAGAAHMSLAGGSLHRCLHQECRRGTCPTTGRAKLLVFCRRRLGWTWGPGPRSPCKSHCAARTCAWCCTPARKWAWPHPPAGLRGVPRASMNPPR